MIAECGIMQNEVDAIYTFIENVEKATGKFDQDELREYFENYYPTYALGDDESALLGKTYLLDENKCGFSTVRFEKADDGVDIYITSEDHVSKIPLRSQKWEKGVLYGKYAKPVLEQLTVNYSDPLEFSCTGKLENGNILAVMRGTNCPHLITYLFEVQDNEKIIITRKGNKNANYDYVFTGSEI
jgi:hypothetical protein